MTGTQKPFRIETQIAAPADTIWRHLTEPALIRDWFGWEYPGLDDEIRQIYIEGADPQPPDRIAFGDGQEMLLVAGRQRTVLRVATTRALPPGGDPHRHDPVEEGWRVFFEQLRFLLERRPGERRHTLYLTGRASGRELLELIESAADKEVWHSSRFAQLTVDREENLIAAATQEPITTDRPGPVSVTVNGYGLDTPSRIALRERWLARWQVADAAITP